MCATCGCGDLENKHGDSRNITLRELHDSVLGASAFTGKECTAEDIKDNIHDALKGEVPLKDLKNKALRKVARGLGDEIADAILKGQRREETGRFIEGKDDVHSHRMTDGVVVTHSHDNEKGHTHPSREYGPSFHHR